MRFKPISVKRVIVGLTLLSLMGWRVWIIPRIDRRFVGRWQCTTSTSERQFVTLYLRDDGRGKYTWQEDGTAHVENYPWALSGSTLQVHALMEDNRSTRGIERLVDTVIFAFERPRVAGSCESWKVLSIASDELQVRQNSNSAVLTFKRIPSGPDL
jgi:hypothetical protein